MDDMERLEWIRQWLRYHSGYRLTIDPWGLYGLWGFCLIHPDGRVSVSRGETLAGRLDDVESWIAEVSDRSCTSCGKTLSGDEGSLCEACSIQLEV